MIDRYDIEDNFNNECHVRNNDGDWVKFDDHKALVIKLFNMIDQNYLEDDELEFLDELEGQYDIEGDGAVKCD